MPRLRLGPVYSGHPATTWGCGCTGLSMCVSLAPTQKRSEDLATRLAFEPDHPLRLQSLPSAGLPLVPCQVATETEKSRMCSVACIATHFQLPAPVLPCDVTTTRGFESAAHQRNNHLTVRTLRLRDQREYADLARRKPGAWTRPESQCTV